MDELEQKLGLAYSQVTGNIYFIETPSSRSDNHFDKALTSLLNFYSYLMKVNEEEINPLMQNKNKRYMVVLGKIFRLCLGLEDEVSYCNDLLTDYDKGILDKLRDKLRQEANNYGRRLEEFASDIKSIL